MGDDERELETRPGRTTIVLDDDTNVLDAPVEPDQDLDLDLEEELWTDDSSEDYSGWFCVQTDPFPCPADGCGFVAGYMTASHLIIVWPEMDDPSLLRHAAAARDVGRNPKPLEYEPAFGPACSYYLWEAAGFPVHAVRSDDGGVYDKKRG